MLKSIAAVVAGYAVIAVVAGVAVPALALLLLARDAGAIRFGPGLPYLGATLVLSLAGAIAGGWVAARVAGRARLAHALVLGSGVAVLALFEAMKGAKPSEPSWYGWSLVLLALVGPPLGSLIEARRARLDATAA